MPLLIKTPKNLVDAIENGLAHSPQLGETLARRAFTLSERAEIARDVEPYVRDFMCDKLTHALIENGERARDVIRALYRSITGTRPPEVVADPGAFPTL